MVQGEGLLLVEDDAATREVLALLLEAEGWQVHAAETGEEAVEWLRGQGRLPAVVLCDLHLPGMYGEVLARVLRECGAGCVVAMSATARGQVEGYDAALLKPFPPGAVQVEWERVCAAGGGVAGAEGSMPVDGNASAVEKFAVVDGATLATLKGSMGARGLQGLYAFALADTGDRLERMAEAVKAGDAAAYVREAHAVKGSAGMLGARRLWQAAGSAETGGLADKAGETVSRMHGEVEALRLMLETLFPVEPELLSPVP